LSAAGAAGATVAICPPVGCCGFCVAGEIGCTGKSGGTTATGAGADAEMLPVMVGSRGLWSTRTGLSPANFSCVPGEDARSLAMAAALEASSQLVHSVSAATDELPDVTPSPSIRIFD
jgi:hypothetical protein